LIKVPRDFDNVFADKVVELGLGILRPVGVKVDTLAVAEVFKAGHVADGRVEPNVEILARCIGYFKAKIGRIAADIPLLQTRIEPLGQFVGDFFRDVAGACPLFQEAFKLGQFEKVMGRFFFYRRGTGDGRLGVDQISGCIGGATGFTVVAVLVVSFTLWAGALDVAVGQKEVFLRVKGLGDFSLGNMAIAL